MVGLINIINSRPPTLQRIGRGVEEDEVVITISDTGAGIPKELLDRIFLPFVTTKGALSRSEVPGMGLGLCACQGIARSHHGDISVHSTPGKGTTFTIHLPLGDSGGSAGAPAAESEGP